MATNDLTAQRLRELLDYDPKTGAFNWKPGRRGAPNAGHPGCITGGGYRAITVDGVLHSAHRLAWLHMTSVWPDGAIDHINGVRDDNRIENLRDVPAQVNRQNLKGSQANNKSGYLGVVWDKYRFKWKAQIYVARRLIPLGRFDDPRVAHEAYLEAKRRLHPGCTI